MNQYLVFLIVVVLAFVVGCTQIAEQAIGEQSESTDEVVDVVNNDEIKKTQSGTKYIIHPSKILSGGPPKDGIPSIDNPRYNPIEGIGWIEDNELVMAINYKGIKRVYPLQIMVWHEIVNDKFGDEKVLITYCPLCGSGIAYKPVIEVNGVKKEVEFGTSGKLYNSNLVMYDRETESYWSQIGGKAIIGELTGQQLEAISIDTVVWRDYKDNNHDAEVLSKSTGHTRNYGRDPYGNYYEDSFLIFPVENEDDRIHPKTIIFGIEKDGKFKAYREDILIEAGGMIIDSDFGVTVTRSDDGVVKIVDENGKEIVKERDMWFAWYAFHPETILYKVNKS